MMIGSCLSAIISSFLNASPNKKLLNYGYLEQIKDILPAMLLSLAMGGMAMLWTLTSLGNITMLICQVITGIIAYVAGSKIFKLDSYTYIINMIKNIKNKKSI